jgi:uncharacterized protein (DUF1697 family)
LYVDAAAEYLIMCASSLQTGICNEYGGTGMCTYIALLRAVNVGGTDKLPMSELKAMCEQAGFCKVRTYIASGNVLFESKDTVNQMTAALESRLEAYAGKRIGVLVRTAAEMTAVLAANPFADSPPNGVVTIFLDTAPPADVLDQVTGRKNERMALGAREIYVHYANGMGDSTLKITAAKTGTARNMNTVARLAAMAAE